MGLTGIVESLDTVLGVQSQRDFGYYFGEVEKCKSRLKPFGNCQVENGPQGRTLTKREKLQGDRFWFSVRKKCLIIRTAPEQNKLSL